MFAMPGYTAAEVAQLLGLPATEVRAWVRDGLIAPVRGVRGELLFSFQDLVLLRTAKGLTDGQVPRARVRRALKSLKARLPAGQPLSGLQISVVGNRVVVVDGDARVEPESGQVLFDFEVRELQRDIESLETRRRSTAEISAERRAEGISAGDAKFTAEDEYQRAYELENSDPEAALAGYRRAVALDGNHADAHVNLGRMLHDRGELPEAEKHYRAGLAARPDDVIAAFNLGVALEDLGQLEKAVDAYRCAIAIDVGLADAYYNLSRVCERLGRRAEALRYLKDYRRLTR